MFAEVAAVFQTFVYGQVAIAFGASVQPLTRTTPSVSNVDTRSMGFCNTCPKNSVNSIDSPHVFVRLFKFLMSDLLYMTKISESIQFTNILQSPKRIYIAYLKTLQNKSLCVLLTQGLLQNLYNLGGGEEGRLVIASGDFYVLIASERSSFYSSNLDECYKFSADHTVIFRYSVVSFYMP